MRVREALVGGGKRHCACQEMGKAALGFKSVCVGSRYYYISMGIQV